MANDFREFFAGKGGMMFKFPAEMDNKYDGKKVIICGDANVIWADLISFDAVCYAGRGSVRKDGYDIMAVNHGGCNLPAKIEHWYSNNGHKIQPYVDGRRCEYVKEFPCPMHSHSCNKGAKYQWPWSGDGTSGLCATLTALALGYDEVVLCGIPLSNQPHNGEPYWRRTNFVSEVANEDDGPNKQWMYAIQKVFRGKVRSMSGRTKEWIELEKKGIR